jgi:hypothetical protein
MSEIKPQFKDEGDGTMEEELKQELQSQQLDSSTSNL